MTTSKEKKLRQNMSRLTIDEVTTQNESNSQSGRCRHEISLGVEMAAQDNGMLGTCTEKAEEDLAVDKARQMAFDQREDGIMAKTLCKAREADNIHVNENKDTVIIDLGSQHGDHSTRGCETKTSQSDDFPNNTMNHFAHFAMNPLPAKSCPVAFRRLKMPVKMDSKKSALSDRCGARARYLFVSENGGIISNLSRYKKLVTAK